MDYLHIIRDIWESTKELQIMFYTALGSSLSKQSDSIFHAISGIRFFK